MGKTMSKYQEYKAKAATLDKLVEALRLDHVRVASINLPKDCQGNEQYLVIDKNTGKFRLVNGRA